MNNKSINNTSVGLKYSRNMFYAVRYAPLLSGLACVGLCGQSQAAETEEVLPEVVVTATALDMNTEGNGQWRTANSDSATRLPMTLRETPQSVSTLTRQRLDDRQLNTLDEAMREVPGVNVLKQSDNQYRFESRGFEMTNIQQDGLSNLSRAITGNASMTSTESNDLFIYDHVDVLRGASGLTQGSGSPGGTINLVRKRPTRDFQAFTTFEVGSWGKRRNEFDLAGPIGLNGALRGRLVGFDDRHGGPADQVEYHTQGLYGVVDYDLTDNTEVSAGIYWQHSDNMQDAYGVPFYKGGRDSGLSRSTYLGADWNRERFDKLNLFFDLKHFFANDWVLTSSFNYTRSNSSTRYGAVFGSYDPEVLTSKSGRSNNSAEQVAFNINATGPFTLLGRKHELVVGSDISVEANMSRQRYLERNPVGGYDQVKHKFSSIDQVHNQPEPDWSQLAANTRRPLLRQQAVYGTARFSLTDSVKLITGVRVSEYDSIGRTVWYDNDQLYSRFQEHGIVTPYGGITWDFAPHWTAYASYTDIFRPQSDRDRDGKTLDPVKGKSYETGIKGDMFDKRLSASIALFRIDEANRAVTDWYDGPNCPNHSCQRAAGLIRSQGIEVEVTGSPVDGMMLGGSYTYNDIFYAEDEKKYQKGERANSYTPRHLFRFYGDYRLPGEWHKWRVGAGISTQSGTSSIKPFSIAQGGYTLFDASVLYSINSHVDLALKAENLTDKRYYQSYSNRSDEGYNFFGTPRNVAMKVTLRY